MKQNARIIITGKTVVLVPYNSEHVVKYHGWLESTELRQLTSSERLTLDEEHQMQEHWRQDEDKCTFIVLDAELYSETGDEIASMIGDTNLFLTKDQDQSVAEIEIMIAETRFQGKGRGKEAVLLMMNYGIHELAIRKFVAKVGLENVKSVRLFENLGFNAVSTSDVFQEVTLEKIVQSDSLDRDLEIYQVSIKK